MTDFATLGIKIDSTQAKQGVGDLDKLTAAGARAEASTLGLGRGSKAAAAEATAMAAAAQASARGIGAQALSLKGATAEAKLNTLAMRETLVVARELSRGNFTRLPGSLTLLAQGISSQGSGLSGYASQLLKTLGIIKTVQNAELAEAAASAAASALAVEGAAARAGANITAADTELALAEAEARLTAGSAGAAAAQARLAAAHAAVAAAAREAAIAEDALSVAQGRASEAGAASAAATSTKVTALGSSLAATAIAAGIAYGAFKSFQSVVADSGELDRYAQTLGLTKRQVKDLKDVSITFGDVMKGVWDTIADHTGADRGIEGFKKFAIDQFTLLLKAGVDTFAQLYGYIVGTYRAVIVIWQNFPAALGDVFYSGVNAAIGAINKLLTASISGVNGFLDKVNSVLPEKLQLSHLAGVQIDQVANQYAGAAKKVASALSSEVKKATAEGRATANGIVAELRRNIIAEAENRIKNEKDPTEKKPKKPKRPRPCRSARRTRRADQGQLALAEAYQVSDAAAIKAEAMQKAEEQAIRHKGEVGMFYEKELALAVANALRTAGRLINQLSAQTAAQKALNDAVAAGTMTASASSQRRLRRSAASPTARRLHDCRG
jgi:hypothetical protein